MKIRERYPILDRIKVLSVLLVVLLVLFFCTYIRESKEEIDSATIEKLLETAIEPIGSTMYIWGGGWDDMDSESGAGSTRIGLSPQWEEFANQQDETYNFEEYRYEREKGLDCSGYVGWVIYNTFETQSGQLGYVTTSTDFAESLANRGWGTLIQNPKRFLPGDIVSMEGHVWICIGTCEDGSVLLIHSSPPGVSVCGTSLKKTDEERTGESIAQKLATDFMTTYYPKWQERYSDRNVSSSYLENVSVFRWNVDVMLDAKEMQKLSGEEVIVYMSPDI